jgi:hypothetical protein
MVHKVKILAVDDRPENLLALEAALSSPQYEVIAKQSGEGHYGICCGTIRRMWPLS